MEPGDSITTNCIYSSLTRNCSTEYGQAVSDEMCFAFITYYPLTDNFYYCNQWKNNSGCSGVRGTPCQDPMGFIQLLLSIGSNPACTSSITDCAKNCRGTIETVKSTGCLSPDATAFLVTMNYFPEYQINDILGCAGLPNVILFPPPTCIQEPRKGDDLQIFINEIIKVSK